MTVHIYIDSIQIAEAGVNPDVIANTQQITLSSNPTPGDTITFNGGVDGTITFTFVAAAPGVNEVLIGLDTTETAANLAAAINGIYGAEFYATSLLNVVTVTAVLMDVMTSSTTSGAISLGAITGATPTTAPVMSAMAIASETIDSLMEVMSEQATVGETIDSLMETIDEDVEVSETIESLMEGISEGATASEDFDDLMPSNTENVNVSASFNSEYSYTNDESLVIEDTAESSMLANETVDESLGMGDDDTLLLTMPVVNSESLDLAEALSETWCLSISDILFIWDTLRHGWYITASDGIEFTDTTAEVLGLLISDWLTLVDSQTNNWNGRDIVNDTIYLYDIADKYAQIAETISEGISLVDANSYVLTVAILDYLGFSEVAAAMKTMASTISESMAITDSVDKAWQEIITEVLSSVDATTVIATFASVISESLTVADAASVINRLGLSIDESLVLAETLTSKGTMYSSVTDTLKMNVTVTLSGEVYECYALNTPKFYPSMYSGFDFNSYCTFENRAFGANDTGIYELTGSTDAGATIHTGVILNSSDFGSKNQKRFRRAYLGISGSQPVMIFEEGDGTQRRVYNIDMRRRHEGKLVASSDLKSKEWKLSIAEFDELDTIKLIPVILSK